MTQMIRYHAKCILKESCFYIIEYVTIITNDNSTIVEIKGLHSTGVKETTMYIIGNTKFSEISQVLV